MVFFHRSYLEGLKRGYLTQDPLQYHDPNVCAPYITASSKTGGSSSSKRDGLTNSDSLRRASLRQKRANRILNSD